MYDQKIAKKSPSGRHCTTLSGYIFATKAHIDNQKKLLNSSVSPHMSSQYGELWPTSGWDLLASLGHPCKFQRFHILTALLRGTLVVGISQTLRHWTESATYIQQGGHHVGHWPTFLVYHSGFWARYGIANFKRCTRMPPDEISGPKMFVVPPPTTGSCLGFHQR